MRSKYSHYVPTQEPYNGDYLFPRPVRRRRRPFKAAGDVAGVILCLVVAFGVGAILAVPLIFKMEVASSFISYMNRH